MTNDTETPSIGRAAQDEPIARHEEASLADQREGQELRHYGLLRVRFGQNSTKGLISVFHYDDGGECGGRVRAAKPRLLKYNLPRAIYLKRNYIGETIKINCHFHKMTAHNRHQNRLIVWKQSLSQD